jgi:hypothetical protein
LLQVREAAYRRAKCLSCFDSLGHLIQSCFAASDCRGGLHQSPVLKVFVENFTSITIFTQQVVSADEHVVEFKTTKRIAGQPMGVAVNHF